MSLACPALIADHFPDLCVPVDIYCERTSATLVAEPVNAISNAAFLIAAWAAWRLHASHPNPDSKRLIAFLILMTAVVGLGSLLFHRVATRWAEWGDVIPIFVFILLYLWLVLTRFFGVSSWLALPAVSLFLTVTVYLEAYVSSAVLWGGALYLPTLFAIVAAGVALSRRQPEAGRALLAAGALFVLSFAARTLDMPLCGALTLGTHFMWHVLNALLLYLLVRLAVLHAPVRVPIVR